MKKIIIITLIIAVILCIIINFVTTVRITVVFKELRPFDDKIPVYYKGLNVGKATDRYHSEDFRYTHIKLFLKNRDLKLPLNTTALMKKRIKNDKEYDYIELIYPEVPSERFIKNGSYILGYSTVDAKEYLKNQNPEDLDKIKTNLMSASQNLNSSLDAIFGLFILIQDVLQENRSNIKNSSNNLKETSENINKATKKIDNIIIEEQWNNTFKNIENSSGGFHDFTKNINGAMSNINKTISNTFEEINNSANNVSSITCGIRQTLSKNFGGLRLFFGKVINEK